MTVPPPKPSTGLTTLHEIRQSTYRIEVLLAELVELLTDQARGAPRAPAPAAAPRVDPPPPPPPLREKRLLHPETKARMAGERSRFLQEVELAGRSARQRGVHRSSCPWTCNRGIVGSRRLAWLRGWEGGLRVPASARP